MAKTISPEAFDELDPSLVTLVDLRDPHERVLFPVEGAVLIPISEGFHPLSELPKDKPVVVFCSVGTWSVPIVDVLTERGYDAASLEGGINRYIALLG